MQLNLFPGFKIKKQQVSIFLLKVKEPVNCGDCERVCSGGNSTPILVEPSSCIQNHTENSQEEIEPNCASPKTSEASSCPESNDEEILKQRVKIDEISATSNSLEKSNGIYEKSDSFQERKFPEVFEQNEKMIDEEPRFLYSDNTSIKSRSLSLTSNCSLFVTSSNDGKIAF